MADDDSLVGRPVDHKQSYVVSIMIIMLLLLSNKAMCGSGSAKAFM
jgi:hypothetical protein